VFDHASETVAEKEELLISKEKELKARNDELQAKNLQILQLKEQLQVHNCCHFIVFRRDQNHFN